MKKGFTLVELSIVIVIIGILMGMTVKGKSLIDSARLKSDMAAINKLRVAVAAYAVDHNAVFPSDAAPNQFSQVALISGNYITDNDLRTKLGANNLRVQQIAIPASNAAVNASMYVDHTDGSDIAVIIGVAVSGSSNKDWTLGCLLDASMDDGLTFSGDIRYFGNQPDNTPRDTNDCKSNTTAVQRYGVLVF